MWKLGKCILYGILLTKCLNPIEWYTLIQLNKHVEFYFTLADNSLDNCRLGEYLIAAAMVAVVLLLHKLYE